ncbi:MAG: hypothetical protein ACLSH5_02905 [Christensenellales bacterium]
MIRKTVPSKTKKYIYYVCSTNRMYLPALYWAWRRSGFCPRCCPLCTGYTHSRRNRILRAQQWEPEYF